MPVRSRTVARKSPPFSASRVALVAAAMISSTLCESASRRNLDSASRPPAIAAGGQRPAVEAPGAEPHHFLLAVDDLEGLIGADLRHDHVHGVGADVDRSQAH